MSTRTLPLFNEKGSVKYVVSYGVERWGSVCTANVECDTFDEAQELAIDVSGHTLGYKETPSGGMLRLVSGAEIYKATTHYEKMKIEGTQLIEPEKPPAPYAKKKWWKGVNQ